MSAQPVAAEVITAEDIRTRVVELGEAITADYAGRRPLFVTVLTGSVLFAADLFREIHAESEIDFLALNRFGESGHISVSMDTSGPLVDREVVIIEEIVDTGLTLNVLRQMVLDRGARSVATVGLLDKARRRVTEVPIEYRGFEVGDEFLVGYGLDWDGLYRNLPSIWAVLDMEAFVLDRTVLARNLFPAMSAI
ncbi:MAG: phosphoribosyltransferase family protein [Acidimicrobiia bacterium]|nr:phosphoribosyltransferase family protein [Acidimicrobiia bacterium]MDH3463248.1 phosphoribosyltransferase family protein [Acidimicrobiia bacterium]